MVFERKFLRRISGPKRNEDCVYEVRTNRDLNNIFNKTNILEIFKSKIISWVGHIWRAKGQFIHTISKWKLNKRRLRGRPRQQWGDRVEG